MLYRIRAGILQSCGKEERYNQQDLYISVSRIGEEPDLMAGNTARTILQEMLEDRSIRYEDRNGIALICFACFNFSDCRFDLGRIYFVFGRGWIQLICEEDQPILKLIGSLTKERNSVWTSGRFLSRLFEMLLNKDSMNYMKDLERQISAIEDGLIKGKGSRKCIREILKIRRRLTELRQVYWETLELLDELSGNSSLDQTSLNHIRSYQNKIDRLYHRSDSLRECAAELLEICRTRTAIIQNAVLKLFTILVSAFLPLFLAAVWCGGKIELPEPCQKWGILLMAAAGVLIILVEGFFFKRNKRL